MKEFGYFLICKNEIVGMKHQICSQVKNSIKKGAISGDISGLHISSDIDTCTKRCFFASLQLSSENILGDIRAVLGDIQKSGSPRILKN